MKPTSFWRAMAGAGGQLREQRPCRNSDRPAPPTNFSDARASRRTRERLEPISKLRAGVDLLQISDDSTHGRAMGTDGRRTDLRLRLSSNMD